MIIPLFITKSVTRCSLRFSEVQMLKQWPVQVDYTRAMFLRYGMQVVFRRKS